MQGYGGRKSRYPRSGRNEDLSASPDVRFQRYSKSEERIHLDRGCLGARRNKNLTTGAGKLPPVTQNTIAGSSGFLLS